MEPKDLRIGNLIHLSKYIRGMKTPYGEFRVLTLSLFDFECLPVHVIPAQAESFIKEEYSQIEPIPLTEDWLLKFGFEKIVNETYINGNQFTLQVTGERKSSGNIDIDETWFDGIGDLSWLKSGGVKTVCVNVLCRGNYVCNAAKHVHQLQNLFFALTGEELEIKKVN